MRHTRHTMCKLIFPVLFFAVLQAPVFSQPDPARVKSVFAQILAELTPDKEAAGKDNEIGETLVRIIEQFFDFLRQYGGIVIVVLVFFFLFLFFLIAGKGLAFFKSERKAKSRKGKNKNWDSKRGADRTDNKPDAVSVFYGLALNKAEAADYTQAVLFLHRATVVRLEQMGILQAGGVFTNNEIMALLTGNLFYTKPFALISGYAEKILFRSDTVSAHEFAVLLNSYQGVFDKIS